MNVTRIHPLDEKKLKAEVEKLLNEQIVAIGRKGDSLCVYLRQMPKNVPIREWEGLQVKYSVSKARV